MYVGPTHSDVYIKGEQNSYEQHANRSFVRLTRFLFLRDALCSSGSGGKDGTGSWRRKCPA